MTRVKSAVAALLFALLNAGCGNDAIPAAQAEAPDAGFYYEMSGAKVPASAGDGQVYEYH